MLIVRVIILTATAKEAFNFRRCGWGWGCGCRCCRCQIENAIMRPNVKLNSSELISGGRSHRKTTVHGRNRMSEHPLN